ncbi:hypothetical protein [Sphingomonas sp.]|uniref:hypothetical protein n=1 Tax=Sphingomonas sp. TaxID=28214 RepID=UPI000DB4425F|nr:hypothetical protein [Sphingomonas sp.]PZU09743.1 MAG: hypothetical protein DI605_08860 [Sphingomonas sp.]
MAQKTPKTGIVLACLLAIVLIALGAAYLFRQPAPSGATERAAARIARDCAGGNQIRNEGDVAAGLSDHLTKLSGKSSVSSSDIGQITSGISQDDIGLKFYAAYTKCLKQGTENWLALNGVPVRDAPGEMAAPMPGAAPAAGGEPKAAPSTATGDNGIAVIGSINNSNLSVDGTHH